MAVAVTVAVSDTVAGRRPATDHSSVVLHPGPCCLRGRAAVGVVQRGVRRGGGCRCRLQCPGADRPARCPRLAAAAGARPSLVRPPSILAGCRVPSADPSPPPLPRPTPGKVSRPPPRPPAEPRSPYVTRDRIRGRWWVVAFLKPAHVYCFFLQGRTIYHRNSKLYQVSEQ